MKLAYGLISLTLVGMMVAAFVLSENKSEDGAYILKGGEGAEAPEEGASAPGSDNKYTMLELTSPVFVEGGLIPKKYTCDGENVNPELRFSGVPEGTKSLVLLMDDPDIPDFVREQMNITVFDHWVLFNIPATIAVIKENTVPEGATVGKNSRGTHIYSGPCPPDTEHRYFWKLFALDIVLELGEDVTKEQVQSAIEGHVLHATTLLGRYARLSE